MMRSDELPVNDNELGDSRAFTFAEDWRPNSLGPSRKQLMANGALAAHARCELGLTEELAAKRGKKSGKSVGADASLKTQLLRKMVTYSFQQAG